MLLTNFFDGHFLIEIVMPATIENGLSFLIGFQSRISKVIPLEKIGNPLCASLLGMYARILHIEQEVQSTTFAQRICKVLKIMFYFMYSHRLGNYD